MAHNDPMTWRPKDRRWTKYYGKKHYYVSHRQLVKAGLLDANAPNTKDGTRTAMREWWKQTEAKLIAETEAAREPRTPEGVYLSGVGVDYNEDGKPTKNRIRLGIKQQVTDPDGIIGDHIRKLMAEGEQRVQNLYTQPPAEQTIGPHVKAFVAFKRQQAEAGERSLGRADCLRLHLDKFLEWIGTDHPVAKIGEQTVQEYYQHALGEARKGEISRYYARGLVCKFQAIRAMARGPAVDPNSAQLGE